MFAKNIIFFSLGLILIAPHNSIADVSSLSLMAQKKLTLQQQLGQKIFFDENLSSPAGQSCATCHDVKVAFTDPLHNTPVSLGAVEGRTGTRNTPSVGYTAFAPAFHYDSEEHLYIGGQFLDGRAENLIEQAKAPFLNPDEMNNVDEHEVIEKIKQSGYVDFFKQVYGDWIFNETAYAYEKVAQALSAFENTLSFNQFTSKYDYYLTGRVELTEQEQKGLELFEDENKGNCAACHPSSTTDGSAPLLTDFTYDNLGTPSNPDILAKKGDDFIDLGLGETVKEVAQNGKFKVPSLRNVALTAPYMHNGVFADLTQVVDFYNTREVDKKWPEAEVKENVNTDELGDLKLSDDEVEAIVAFLHTLSDGYQLYEQVTFNTQNQVLEIPYIRVEGKQVSEKFYSAQLRQQSDQSFKLEKINAIDIQDYSVVDSMPFYSVDTGKIEFPLVSTTSSAGSPSSYVVQLKKENGTEDNLSFSINYLKAIAE